ncbi:MAG: hypothetical protein A2Y25_04495 [Candidatus Melainabacteria bacterium GWF2_37_15]|nr:MAG: hypothetical protein A2Y25_04495 [Candidatus Melainabacteria bacterium GWF2_37_15]
MMLKKNRARRGTALVISMFISVIAALMTITMMGMVNTNTSQITDNKSGIIASYAAEAGVEEVKNYFNRNMSSLGEDLSDLPLPESGSSYVLANDAEYWVDSLSYEDSNTTIVVNIVGQYGNAYRKARVKMKTVLPDVFNDYGLLTEGVIDINGNKTLGMSIHGNGGLDLNGRTNFENNATATQSNDPTADPPDPNSNPIGGYVPEIDVPSVPIDELRIKSQEDGIILDINQADLMDQINNAPPGSKIYISGNLAQNPEQNIFVAFQPRMFLASIFSPMLLAGNGNGNGNSNNNGALNLSGDMQGKLIFIDGDITVNAQGLNNLADVTIVSSGELTVNGSIDIGTAHPGYTDVIFACNDSVTLNGSRRIEATFWTNGSFRQNGSSMAGRVIAQSEIRFNGNFTLEAPNDMYGSDFMDKTVQVVSWQQVSMD